MRYYTTTQARRNLSELLDFAKSEEVFIRRGREVFSIVPVRARSPFDVPSVKTKATTADILDAIREVRARPGKTTRTRR